MGIEPYLAASALRGIVAQRLVRRLCPVCRKEYMVDGSMWEGKFLPNKFSKRNTQGETDRQESFSLYRQSGCEACRQSGYRGRLAIHEVLPISTALKDKIIYRASEQELWAAAKTEFPEMVSLEEDGVRKVKEGVTSVQELLRVLGV